MSGLYDVFVDWPGRLGRELPGIERQLAALGRGEAGLRVLDLGCGTGRHVAALLERGHDAHGADASEEMLDRARSAVADPRRLHAWRLGEPPPRSLAGGERFDALISMGNVWPALLAEAEVSAACAAILALLVPGGLLLLGLKAHRPRREARQPYLPLLKRRHGDRDLWFVRFLDFDPPPLPDGTEVCELHLAVVGGAPASGPERAPGELEALLHTASPQRVWSPAELRRRLAAEGFERVRLGGRLDDLDAPVVLDDVFVTARAPRR